MPIPPPHPPKAYRFHETLVVQGRTRTYTLVLPPSYDDKPAFPLVLALHGGGGSAAQFEASTQLTDKAKTAGFVVVYPNGTGPLVQTWNAGQCCFYALNNQVDDVQFFRQLIDQLIARYKINPKQVYATGHSNGGMMCYRLACELSDKLAAIAPNACTSVVNSCRPARAVPIIHFQAKNDERVPYRGGYGVGRTGLLFRGVADVLTGWAARNGCPETRPMYFKKSGYDFYQWGTCSTSRIDYYLTDEGGHSWPGGQPGRLAGTDRPTRSLVANELLWDFFAQHQLP